MRALKKKKIDSQTFSLSIDSSLTFLSIDSSLTFADILLFNLQPHWISCPIQTSTCSSCSSTLTKTREVETWTTMLHQGSHPLKQCQRHNGLRVLALKLIFSIQRNCHIALECSFLQFPLTRAGFSIGVYSEQYSDKFQIFVKFLDKKEQLLNLFFLAPHPVGLKDQQLPEFLSSTKSFVDFQTCVTAGRGAVKSPDCPNFLFLSEQKLQFCSYPPSTFNTSFLPHNILNLSHNSRYMFSCLHAICLCLCDDLLFNFWPKLQPMKVSRTRVLLQNMFCIFRFFWQVYFKCTLVAISWVGQAQAINNCQSTPSRPVALFQLLYFFLLSISDSDLLLHLFLLFLAVGWCLVGHRMFSEMYTKCCLLERSNF